jgi:phenylacetate-CoA ligase
MEEAQWLSREVQEERTARRLALLLGHARDSVAFYRARPELEEELTGATARAVLSSLPVMTKRDLLEVGVDQLVSKEIPGHRRLERATSGSTGEPFHFFIDRAALPTIYASHLFYDWSCGLGVGDRYIRLVAPITARDDLGQSAPRGSRFHHKLIRRARHAYEDHTQRHLWVTSVDGDAADAVRQEIETFSPAFLLGYTSTLAAVAAELLERGVPLRTALRGVITIAELLTPERRRLIELYFGAPIVNRYGLREFGSWSGQSCSTSPENVHMNTELVDFEILRGDGSPAEVGEVGRLVMTDLHNFAMPWIRYDTGDLAIAQTASCECGRSFPVISLEGRSHESLRVGSGRIITSTAVGDALSVVADATSQYQLVREADGRVRVVLVPGVAFGVSTPARVQQLIQDLVGEEVQVSVDIADSIAPDASGKRPIVKAGLLDRDA